MYNIFKIEEEQIDHDQNDAVFIVQYDVDTKISYNLSATEELYTQMEFERQFIHIPKNYYSEGVPQFNITNYSVDSFEGTSEVEEKD